MTGLSTLDLLLLVVPIALLAVTLVLGLVASRRSRARKRLGVDVDENEIIVDDESHAGAQGVVGWLGRAGYRSPNATILFAMALMGSAAVALFLAVLASGLNVFNLLAISLEEIPGNFASLFSPLLRLGPWLVFFFVTAIPILHVRSRRRKLVEDVERELPLVLELLATLAEAGMGFDSAIQRLVASDKGAGRVGGEFRVFQRESLSGVPRVRCLRRMAERLNVPMFSTFVSSLVQAERSGFGLGEVLRSQAGDLRNRRRESALMRAQALPVKLVFPLVLCFLPGLFVLTLGPAFYTFFQLADAVTKTLE